jgi:hypothetical protein
VAELQYHPSEGQLVAVWQQVAPAEFVWPAQLDSWQSVRELQLLSMLSLHISAAPGLIFALLSLQSWLFET